jgi:hypothetical protein
MVEKPTQAKKSRDASLQIASFTHPTHAIPISAQIVGFP